MEKFLLAGDGWRRTFSAEADGWSFRGGAGRGVIRRGRGKAERLRYDDPLPILRRLLAAEGGPAVGYFGYEAFASPEERCMRGASPVPDFVWMKAKAVAAVSVDSLSQEPSSRLPPLKRGRAAYERSVRRIRNYIAAGDVYQANLSHKVERPFRGSPRAYFERLHALNPSPYALYLDAGDFQLASNSPELLLRVEGGRVETRPIAGTRPRGKSAAEDRRLAGELLLSPKERAEHVMLLDLERNDLGCVCRPGSVRVTERLALERYSHVTHIVSHVEGRLAPGRDGFDAVRAVFPGGTITGCPKVRCMEILADLERSPRGPFYGAAGWIAPGGDMELNILIRTALFRKGRMSFRVGAGIVADSRPGREWKETLHKAGALLEAYELS